MAKVAQHKTEIVSKSKPYAPLTVKIRKTSGRDKTGRISVRHRGGGSKRKYRLINFKNLDPRAKWEVVDIQYDPNRSANIALVKGVMENQKEIYNYIISPVKLKINDIIDPAKPSSRLGSRMKLADISLGQQIYNIELQVNKGGQLVRSAGSSAVITAKEGKYAHIKLPSGEIRKILLECMASIGQVSNQSHNLQRIRKAGIIRHKGRRPTVRGKAMSPKSHPHGGGEGVNPIGLKYPKTPWGKPALGVRTRRNKKTNIFIIKRRHKK